MRGFWLLIPFFLIRFGLLAVFDKDAVKRAAHFAPVQGNEAVAYYIYQISNIAVFGYILFTNVTLELSTFFYLGMTLYVVGLVLCAVTVVNFSDSSNQGFHCSGLYRFSRNPMYVSYFIFFIGCVILAKSWILFGILLIFQVSSHWIILSEERWCAKQFGDEYEKYRARVRRYI